MNQLNTLLAVTMVLWRYILVELTKGYFLDSDSYNIILKKKTRAKNKDTGKMETVYDIKGYFGTIEGAIKSMVNQHSKELIECNKKMTLADVYRELYLINNELDNIINTHKRAINNVASKKTKTKK